MPAPVRAIGVALIVALVGLSLAGSGSRAPTLHLGAVFPTKGTQSPLGLDELRGVKAAVSVVNASGGVDGERVALDVRNLEVPAQAASVVARLAHDPVIIGAYSSQLSIPTAVAASRLSQLYWEAGAVADQLTGSGSPWVFRVGATGWDLGTNSLAFAAADLSARLGKTVGQTRVSVVWEQDAYGTSVADAAMAKAREEGMQVVSQTTYDAYAPDWPHVLAAVRAAHPDILVLASYIPDGVAFRKAMLAARLQVGALIGSTMAECVPDFGNALGTDAVGIFGSDRPGEAFNPEDLNPAGRAAYEQLAAALGHRPPTEEELSGFTATWALLRDVLPNAHGFSPAAIATAARGANVPTNDLPNGAGLKFASDPAHLGQNERAAAIIWQWQAPHYSVVVWPPSYTTGKPILVPLPVAASAGVVRPPTQTW